MKFQNNIHFDVHEIKTKSNVQVRNGKHTFVNAAAPNSPLSSFIFHSQQRRNQMSLLKIY